MSVRPFGSWPSPITAAALTTSLVQLAEPRFDGGDVYWLEGRPSEGGRVVLQRRGADGRTSEVLDSPDVSIRTAVHEYGGAPWIVERGTVFFSDLRSQRIFRMDRGRAPRAITPDPPRPGSLRYADARVTRDGRWLVAVREEHRPDGPPINQLVLIPSDGSEPPRTLVGGRDFFSSPRLSPDGTAVLWLSWDHPRMPWDGTDLWVADLGSGLSVGTPRHLAGGSAESIFQPEWCGSGGIVFVSDRTGWGNLYRVGYPDAGSSRPLLAREAEFATPQWVFGLSRYAQLARDRLVVVSTRDGRDEVGILDSGNGRYEPWETGYSSISAVASDGGGRVALIGASPRRAPELAVGTAGASLEIWARSIGTAPDPGYLSEPEHIEFPTGSGERAYAFLYPPRNPQVEAPGKERPPLIVTSHGGPTSRAETSFNLALQFWTSRGFAVVDVNYRGSTGYGREYMESLRGQWGVRDVEDCVAAAGFLASAGRIDRNRMAIRGKSASGLTTLAALVFHDVFRAGASYYGVADLESLARDTHKFESRYLDTLVGPWPEAAQIYRSRSPLTHAGRLQTPVIFFQGLQDPVVPPSQPAAMIRVLEARKLPYAYVTFATEQHGFRQADSVRRSLEAELYFYSRILGFQIADAIEPITIENL